MLLVVHVHAAVSGQDGSPTARDRWSAVDLPLLRQINDLASQGRVVTMDSLSGVSGLHFPELGWALRALYDAGYIGGTRMPALLGHFSVANVYLAERGLRTVGAWPADSFDQLLDALRSRIEKEANPDTRDRLTRLFDALAGAGKDIATSVLAEWAKHASGL